MIFRRRDPVPGLRDQVDAAMEEPPPIPSQAPPARKPLDAGDLQVMAHTLIADLFAAGMRAQNLAGRVPEELRTELEDLADQIDKAIHDVRGFVFSHPA